MINDNLEQIDIHPVAHDLLINRLFIMFKALSNYKVNGFLLLEPFIWSLLIKKPWSAIKLEGGDWR